MDKNQASLEESVALREKEVHGMVAAFYHFFNILQRALCWGLAKNHS